MQKIACTFASLLLGAQAMDVQDFITFGDQIITHQDVSKTKLGHVVETKMTESHIHKKVTPRTGSLGRDEGAMTEYIKDIMKFHKERDQKMLEGTFNYGVEPIYTCSDRAPDANATDLGEFLPVFAADLTPASPSGTWKGRCFDEIEMKYVPVNSTQFQV